MAKKKTSTIDEYRRDNQAGFYALFMGYKSQYELQWYGGKSGNLKKNKSLIIELFGLKWCCALYIPILKEIPTKKTF